MGWAEHVCVGAGGSESGRALEAVANERDDGLN